MTTTIYRQGDVALVRIGDGREAIPADARPTTLDEAGRIVLAHGERTGHAHAIRDPLTCGWSTLDSGQIEYLLVGGGGTSLRHELISGAPAEHTPVALPPGAYRVLVQVEYTPAALVRVTD